VSVYANSISIFQYIINNHMFRYVETTFMCYDVTINVHDNNEIIALIKSRKFPKTSYDTTNERTVGKEKLLICRQDKARNNVAYNYFIRRFYPFNQYDKVLCIRNLVKRVYFYFEIPVALVIEFLVISSRIINYTNVNTFWLESRT